MKSFRERAKELVGKMTLAEKISQMCYDAPAIERLGVPAYNWWNECLHGVARSGVATVFPQAIAMAASFNTELMHEVATAISDEARAKYNEYRKFGSTLIYQGLTFWSPNINIFRDPRWGRGHETYGEDPYLTGEMGVAFIKGLQGDGKYRKVDATIKHYAVHSGPESKRHSFDARVNDKDLYETYLWAFKYCIDNAKPSAVMGAYNRINGEPACASKTYLKKVLFEEFGFDGYVVSDCGAICDINNHHKVTANYAESAALAVNNGCHLNCGDAYKWLKTAVASGLVSEETITEAVERLFEARFRLGMFDDDCEYDNIPYEVIECEKHRELNRKMAAESIVLLKNDGILPLDPGKTIAVIGPNADDISVLLGNYNGTPSRYSTLLQGIRDAASSRVIYARGCKMFDDTINSWEENPTREAIIAAQKSDVVILCMGLNPSMEGEEGDAYNGALGGDKADLELPPSQKRLYEEIKKVGKPIIFVNVSGSCINLSDQDRNCNAVIQCFYPGAEGGNALADVIFGKANPSGRLPVTFYKSVDDLPPFEDYSMENRTYRFFKGDVVYPFGYGLSYSTFEYRDDKICGGEMALTVKNTGKYDGKVVIKVYDTSENKRLIGFTKVHIDKSESRQVEVKLLYEPEKYMIEL
ncbi:MAG: glycoside hydrolase family 3 protein [Clostridiales bacterium]|jgi:beta-glucosidase|nr:glycoside hydrolase family 3 protein [Clostridiales bacterium]